MILPASRRLCGSQRDPDAALEGQEVLLPPCCGAIPPACKAGRFALGHQTQPPARYSEARAGVKLLRERRDWRPSTYASTSHHPLIAVTPRSRNNSSHPQLHRLLRTALLEEHFPIWWTPAHRPGWKPALMNLETGKRQWLPLPEQTSFKGTTKGLETWCSKARGRIDPTAIADHRHGRSPLVWCGSAGSGLSGSQARGLKTEAKTDQGHPADE